MVWGVLPLLSYVPVKALISPLSLFPLHLFLTGKPKKLSSAWVSGEGGRGFAERSLRETWGPGCWALACLASFYLPVKRKKETERGRKEERGGKNGQREAGVV